MLAMLATGELDIIHIEYSPVYNSILIFAYQYLGASCGASCNLGYSVQDQYSVQNVSICKFNY